MTVAFSSKPYIVTMKIFQSFAEAAALVGQEVAQSEWVEITQQQINMFAEATGDHQWIHVDPVRAKSGPFGAPIAHGFLTLSLVPKFFESTIHFPHVKMGVNYGLNKVRFTAPVPVGSRLRARMKLMSVESIEPDGSQLVWEVAVECEGITKPVCIAESIVRLYA